MKGNVKVLAVLNALLADSAKLDIFDPHGSIPDELLKNYILYAHNPLKQFRISEAVLELKNGMGTEGIKEKYEENIFPVIKKARNDAKILIKAKNRFKRNKMAIPIAPCTKRLLSQCIDYIAINEEMKMGNKEWRDVLHTIVPVVYCDFVLIDSRWTNFIKATGLKTPNIAKVYNQREIEMFLKDLECFEIKGHNTN